MKKINGMTQSEIAALKDCHGFHGTGKYIWKPKAMKALAQKGLTKKIGQCAGLDVYELTGQGIEVLKGLPK